MNRIRYRYRAPTIVDAIQFSGKNLEEIIEWFGRVDHHKATRIHGDEVAGTLNVYTAIGVVIKYEKNDWVIVKSDGIINRASHSTFCEIYEIDNGGAA